MNSDLLRTNLLEQATKLGLFDPSDEFQKTQEYQNYIIYLTTTRTTTSFMEFMDLKSGETQGGNSRTITCAFDDILSNFSHEKLTEVCQNPCFKLALEFFTRK